MLAPDAEPEAGIAPGWSGTPGGYPYGGKGIIAYLYGGGIGIPGIGMRGGKYGYGGYGGYAGYGHGAGRGGGCCTGIWPDTGVDCGIGIGGNGIGGRMPGIIG